MKPKKLYQIIMDDITKDIDNGNYLPNLPICTEKSISEKYSVSRITAKKAIQELQLSNLIYRKRGVGSFVNPDAHMQKPQNNEEFKNIDDSFNIELNNNNKKIVAFILPFDIANGGVFKIIKTLNKILNENDIYLTIHISDRDVNKEKEIIKQLQGQSLCSIVFLPVTNNMHVEEFMPFIVKQIPIIVIDISHDCKFMYNIVSDNESGQKLLTQHLIDCGHKKIAYLSEKPIDLLSSIRDRFYGYASTLVSNGLELNYDYIKTEINNKNLEDIIKELVGKGVTAIECEHDEMAVHVYYSCKSLNLNIPGDIAIVGFDDSKWATKYGASITTAKQDFGLIGKKVADIILSHFQNTKSMEYKQILSVELVIRHSTIEK